MTSCFTFDLDGTVTEMELLPLIASTLGLEKEMKLLTKLTIEGVIPFEDSFRLRCACLKSAAIKDVQEIIAEVSLNEEIVGFIKNNIENCAIITGNLDVWIQPLIDRIGCRFYSSKSVIVNGRLTDVASVLHKSHPVLELRKIFDRVISIGDGVNDIPMFEASDVRVAYGGVHNPARQLVEVSDFVVFQGGALCRLLSML